MPRYIDATLLKAEFTGDFIDTSYSPEFIKDIIDRQPTVDVQEIKHGTWLESRPGHCICSRCKKGNCCSWFKYEYCERCGAKMDGGTGNG